MKYLTILLSLLAGLLITTVGRGEESDTKKQTEPSLVKVLSSVDFEKGKLQGWSGPSTRLIERPGKSDDNQFALETTPEKGRPLLIIGRLPQKIELSPDAFLAFDYHVNQKFIMVIWVETSDKGWFEHTTLVKKDKWSTMVVRLGDMISRAESNREGAESGTIREIQVRTQGSMRATPKPVVLIDNVRLVESRF